MARQTTNVQDALRHLGKANESLAHAANHEADRISASDLQSLRALLTALDARVRGLEPK